MFEAIFALLVAGIIIWRIETMNEKLRTALDNLTAEVAESNGKLESIKTFVQGVPELVAAAVATALENADVEAETAAAEVDAARQSVSDNVDATLAAIDENPAEGEENLPPVAEQPTGDGEAPTT